MPYALYLDELDKVGSQRAIRQLEAGVWIAPSFLTRPRALT